MATITPAVGSSAGSGTSSGAAGGVLSGTYPNPGFAADMATQAELDAVAADTATQLDAVAADMATQLDALAATVTNTQIVTLSQAEYDTITPNPAILYVIV